MMLLAYGPSYDIQPEGFFCIWVLGWIDTPRESLRSTSSQRGPYSESMVGCAQVKPIAKILVDPTAFLHKTLHEHHSGT